MTDRPILMSAPMVLACLREADRPGAGKTQTRRVIKLPGIDNVVEFVKVATDKAGVPVYEMKDAAGQHVSVHKGKHFMTPHYSPRFAKGDLLWVRETLTRSNTGGWHYAANLEEVGLEKGDPRIPAMIAWAHHKEGDNCVSIHMPRWASRLTLTVTDVRVERLQAITSADAIAEGFIVRHNHTTIDCDTPDPRVWYRELWDTINGAGSWDANPWVVAVTFKPERRNIDAVPGMMTDRQIELARHALGLNSGCLVSRRNVFVAAPDTPDVAEWRAMEAAGFAEQRFVFNSHGAIVFRLTRTGAERALKGGDVLDPQDWGA